jgi:hypothetical protein
VEIVQSVLYVILEVAKLQQVANVLVLRLIALEDTTHR